MDKTIPPRGLVRGAFEAADLPRWPFLPWIFTHAARLEQVSLNRMYADATPYTKCLQNARKLYGYDAIISGFDASLEAEICGCPLTRGSDYAAPVAGPQPDFDFNRLGAIDVESAARTGRFGTVMESLRRIKMVGGANLALAAVVTGPLTLAATLTGRDPSKEIAERPEDFISRVEAAAAFLLKIVQVYGRLEPDIFVLAEKHVAAFPAAHLPRLRSALSPILNTVRFYNAFSVLLPGAAAPDSLAGLIDLDFDGIVAAGVDFNTWQRIKGGRPCILGKAIPASVLRSGTPALQDYLKANLTASAEPGAFLTTDWEVPPDTPPDSLRLVMNLISGR